MSKIDKLLKPQSNEAFLSALEQGKLQDYLIKLLDKKQMSLVLEEPKFSDFIHCFYWNYGNDANSYQPNQSILPLDMLAFRLLNSALRFHVNR